MKRLYLFRHATAVDKAGPIDDFDRPLTDEGREESRLVGAFMKRRGIGIDCVLCSPSARTRETWDAANARLKAEPQIFFPDRLYKEGEEALYDEISAAPDACKRLLIVGHNPGMEDFARSLANPETSKEKHLVRLMANFPKAVFAGFKLDIESWEEIRPRSGRLTLFKAPKDLRE